MRRPRLAMSGSAGTGKSTLGAALAERLEVPYLREGMRARLERGLVLHDLDHDSLRALILDLWAEQRELEAGAERAHGGFVADRSSLDFAAFWLHYHFHADPERTAAFFDEALGHLDRYDHVVLLPWGALPLVADGVRSSNPWMQRHYQATLEGVAWRALSPPRLLVMPPLTELDERISWVYARIGAS